MAEAKTKPNQASVDEYLNSKTTPEQLADCKTLMSLLNGVTKEAPRMWGPSIVGYGSYSYRYDSGRTGETCITGFAVRGRELVVYLVAESTDQQEMLAKLGKHKMGKACLYLKRLADVDLDVLKGLVAGSVAEIRRRHPASSNA
jgi:Domain of unknown function (DU1801)